MSKRPDSSIARSTFIGVLLTCLAVMASWETISLAREWQARRREIVASGELVARRLANTLSDPLWNFDREEVGRAVEFEIHSPEVLAVVVENDQGGRRRRWFARRPATASPSALTVKRGCCFGIRSPRRAGRCSSSTSASGRSPSTSAGPTSGRQLVRAVWSRVGELLLLVSAILGVVYLIIARRIIGPITALDRSIAGMPADRPRAVPVVGEGEVRRLSESFNAMAGKLDVAFNEQRRLLGELATSRSSSRRWSPTSPASSSAPRCRPSADSTTSARTSLPSPALRGRTSSVPGAGGSTTCSSRKTAPRCTRSCRRRWRRGCATTWSTASGTPPARCAGCTRRDASSERGRTARSGWTGSRSTSPRRT